MDGKLVWTGIMGSSAKLTVSVPDTVDYVIIRRPVPDDSSLQKGIRVMRGCSAIIVLKQGSSSSSYADSYATAAFSDSGELKIDYHARYYSDYLSVEGYQNM